jgi:uncharacterized protein
MVRLLIHAPTEAALNRAHRNLANLLVTDPQAEVELVVNGDAVRAALEKPVPASMPYLVLCENSLTRAGLGKPEGTRTTPAAIVHVAQRQTQGWSYFRS